MKLDMMPITLPCPTCGAKPGETCKPEPNEHFSRKVAAWKKTVN
jgi:hypothetical protein